MQPLWMPKRMIEIRYVRAVRKLMKQFELLAASNSDPDEILQAWKTYAESAEFQREAGEVAMKMVTHLFQDGAKTWRSAARQNSQGKAIYEVLQNELAGRTGAIYYDLIRDNAQLIRTLPESLAEQATAYIAQEQQAGRRAEEIANEIKKLFPEKTKARAELIARTEVSKASTALTRARCETMNIRWYVWCTSRDSRVRDSHDLMDNVLISWENPPSPEQLNHEKSYGSYHAGNTFNCRCYPEPLVELEYINWPHKVYYQNRIQTMTLAEFMRIA